MNPLDILKSIAQQAVQRGASALAQRIATMVAQFQQNGGSLTPADVNLLLTEAKQNGIEIPQEQINAMIGNKQAYTETPAAPGAGLTSGTGDNVSIAQRAQQAAQAAASGGQGQNFNPAVSRAGVTTTPAGVNTSGPSASASNAGYGQAGAPGGYTGAQASVLSKDDAALLDFA